MIDYFSTHSNGITVYYFYPHFKEWQSDCVVMTYFTLRYNKLQDLKLQADEAVKSGFDCKDKLDKKVSDLQIKVQPMNVRNVVQ